MSTDFIERAHQLARQVAEDLDLPQRRQALLIGSGQNCIAFDVSGTLVRVPRHAEAERQLLREADTLVALRARLPAPIPALELRHYDKQSASFHAKLNGTPLMSLATLHPLQQQRLAADLSAFLHALHTLPIALIEPAPQPISFEWREMLQRCETLAFPLLPPHISARVKASFTQFLTTCDALPVRLIHGDFGSGNILTDAGRLSGVIDFSGCGPGDPAYDFASLAAGFGDRFVDRVLADYSPDEGVRSRMAFYRTTFPLLDILHGLEQHDADALAAGLRAFEA